MWGMIRGRWGWPIGNKDAGEEAMERNNWASQNSQRVVELKEEKGLQCLHVAIFCIHNIQGNKRERFVCSNCRIFIPCRSCFFMLLCPNVKAVIVIGNISSIIALSTLHGAKCCLKKLIVLRLVQDKLWCSKIPQLDYVLNLLNPDHMLIFFH